MALRALKTEEEIAGIPLDQEILVELPGAIDEPKDVEVKKPEIDPAAKTLQDQLETLKRESADRVAKAERDANERVAKAEREATEARTRSQSLEGDIISGGLAAAQSERDAAKAAMKTAFEAGDAGAMADAQERIGRAAAKILHLESGAAEIAERKEVIKVEEPQRPQLSVVEQIESRPDLLPTEKTWLKEHLDAFMPGSRNNELSVAYERALKKDLVRGTPAYFAYLEEFMGYKTPVNDGDTDVQAPPSRNDRGNDGRPIGNTVRLSPEQRELAKNMGISDIEYARQVQVFDAARKADPDKYR